MHYLAPKQHDFLTTLDGESGFAVGYPTEATAPLRRVLDAAHPQAATLLVDYLTANQPNPHTRAAYKRALAAFLLWLDEQNLGMRQAKPYDIRRYLDGLLMNYQPATVNQHMAAVRGFYQYMRERTDFDANPASEVKGQRTGDRVGKTPYLPSGETQRLLDSLPPDLMGLRDRALIGAMVYTFTRVSAALSLKVKDYYAHGGNMHLRIVGKRNVQRLIPVHPILNTYLSAYLEEAGLRDMKDAPLFQSGQWRPASDELELPRRVCLTGLPLDRKAALRMIKRRAEQAGIDSVVCCHTFRAVGITAYLENDGAIEKAAHYAGHSSTRTTQIYDKRRDIGSANDIARTRL